MFEIDKGVGVPEKLIDRRTASRKYPFREMEVGDSFLAAGVKQSLVSAAARQASPMKFVTRKVDGGTRCWRVS